jgi:hypothetical protein
MKRLLIAGAFFALAVPAALAAPPTGQDSNGSANAGPSPAALCKQQLKSMGPTNFQSVYAPTGSGKNAWGKCVSRMAQVKATNATNAAKVCKAERGTTTDSIDAFNEKYGTNRSKSNAFGTCVSQKAKQQTVAQQNATLDAAKSCKAERGTTAASIAAFNARYGNKRNAFGKCVSQKAKTKSSS